MKYCPKCKNVIMANNQVCPNCSIKAKEITDESTPVFLTSTGGTDRGRLTAALEDAAIPFIERKHKEMVTVDAVIGVGNIDVDILVPYSAYRNAFDICVGIGVIIPTQEQEQLQEQVLLDEQVLNDQSKENVTKQMQEMSPAKRTTVRILSALAFILLCALAIFGVDFIANIIKALF